MKNLVSLIFDDSTSKDGTPSNLLEFQKDDSKCYKHHCELKYKRYLQKNGNYPIKFGDSIYLATVSTDTPRMNANDVGDEGVFQEIQIVW